MKKLFSRLVKGITVLVSLLALNLTYVPALAQETEICTVVPEKHTVTVILEKGGVVIDTSGVIHTESFTATVAHNGGLSLILRPDSGCVLDSAKLDGQDVAVSGGRMEIEQIRQDEELTIVWKEIQALPAQKTYTVVGTVTENGRPATGVTLELRSKLQTFIIGADGKFRFDKVESGEHNLTALRDGKAVGYLQFDLNEGGTDVTLSKLAEGSFEVRLDEAVTTLKLNIILRGDGIMELTDAGTVSEEQAKDEYPPATGDDAMIICWLTAMLASGVLVFLLADRNRKNRYHR